MLRHLHARLQKQWQVVQRSIARSPRRHLATAGKDDETGDSSKPSNASSGSDESGPLNEELLAEMMFADDALRELEKSREQDKDPQDAAERKRAVSPAAEYFGPRFAADLAPAEVDALLAEMERRILAGVDATLGAPPARLHSSILPILEHGVRFTTHRLYMSGHNLGAHPIERKVALELDTDALEQRGLFSKPLRKAIEVIAGQRFRPPSIVYLTSNRFESRAENARWLLHILDALIQHARFAVGEWDRQQLETWRNAPLTASSDEIASSTWLASRWDTSTKIQLNDYLPGLPQILENERQRWQRIERDLGEPMPFPGSEP
jgi:hypothetical protein